MGAVLAAYDKRVADEVIEPDPAQREAVAALDELALSLGRKRGGWFSRARAPKGLYLWGGVGRGKSMLMDLFYENCGQEARRRVHFHDFMQETHAFINRWRKLPVAKRRHSPSYVRGAGDDPIAPAGKRIADMTSLLCFDEFQVTDIADAMLLGRLYEQLRSRDVVMVATSNRHPDDLYKNGLNRQLFLPVIEMLKESNEIMELRSARDYRLARLEAAPVYYTPLDSRAARALEEAWTRVTAGGQETPLELHVQGRDLIFPRHSGGAVWTSFSELCARALGPADYLSLARHCHTVLIEGVPCMGPENRNAAKRFVTLIDALYEARAKVVISAEAQPDRLYTSGDGAFEFERTASRLYEMRSHDYLAAERVTTDETTA